MKDSIDSEQRHRDGVNRLFVQNKVVVVVVEMKDKVRVEERVFVRLCL